MNDDGTGVCPFAVDTAVVGLVPVQRVIAPQLLAVIVTGPPPLPSVEDETETEHDGGGVVPPGDVQVINRLPLFGATETVDGWQVMLCDDWASTGIDTGARTRLLTPAKTAAPEI